MQHQSPRAPGLFELQAPWSCHSVSKFEHKFIHDGRVILTAAERMWRRVATNLPLPVLALDKTLEGSDTARSTLRYVAFIAVLLSGLAHQCRTGGCRAKRLNNPAEAMGMHIHP